MSIAHHVRTSVAASLVLGAALTVLSVLTMPDFSGDTGSWLGEIAASPGTATVSALTWVTSQLFLAVGVLGVAHLLRSRTPVLAPVAAVLLLLHTFGHAVYGGVNLTMLGMAADASAVDAHVRVLDQLHSGVAVPFMAAGMIGVVLGFLVLGLALWRGRLGPRWLGPLTCLWVVVEFGGPALSPWASDASALLFAVIFATLALTVHRSSIAHWRTAAEVDTPDRAGVQV